MNPKEHHTLHLIAGLSILGFGLAVYLLYLHFAPHEVNSLIPCDINDVFSCSTVNQSAYSLFFGIPVALIGTFGFILLTGLSIFRFKNHKPLLVISATLGFLFESYLTLIEAFVLHAFCYLCLIIYAIMFFITILSIMRFGKETIQFFKNIEFVD